MSLLDTLTNRERDVLTLLAQGKQNKEIAVELMLSPATVENYTHNIFGKLGVPNRTTATIYALSHGLTALPIERESI